MSHLGDRPGLDIVEPELSARRSMSRRVPSGSVPVYDWSTHLQPECSATTARKTLVSSCVPSPLSWSAKAVHNWGLERPEPLDVEVLFEVGIPVEYDLLNFAVRNGLSCGMSRIC